MGGRCKAAPGFLTFEVTTLCQMPRRKLSQLWVDAPFSYLDGNSFKSMDKLLRECGESGAKEQCPPAHSCSICFSIGRDRCYYYAMIYIRRYSVCLCECVNAHLVYT